jgi:hypothetical protein
MANADTCGTPVVAPADATLVEACDVGDPPDKKHLDRGCTAEYQFGPLVDGYDYVRLATAGDERIEYMHVQKGSVRAHFKDVKPRAPLAIAVKRGELVAKAGTRKPNNCHLHFSVGRANGSTYPVAFTDYERFDRRTNTWKPVARGVLRWGDIVRNPKR